MRYLLLILLISTNGFAQVPFGRIHFDLTQFSKSDSLLIIPEKNMMKQVNDDEKSKININVGWINSESEIYKSWKDNSNNSNIVLLDKHHESCIMDQITNCKSYFSGGSVNFSYNANAMHVSLIKLNGKEMYIYLYTGTYEQRNENGFMEVTNVFFDDFEFVEGTFLINLYNENPSVSKYRKNKTTDYYELSLNTLIVKNKVLKISNVSSTPISPEEINKFCDNFELKRPKAIKKILSVFKGL